MLRGTILSLIVMGALFFEGCAPVHKSRPGAVGDVVFQRGLASYYHDSLHGNLTASGVPYDKNKISAAHRSLPFGTRIRVKNLENGKSLEMEVNDRGPFVDGRIVDLSRKAAEELDFIREGIVRVSIVILE